MSHIMRKSGFLVRSAGSDFRTWQFQSLTHASQPFSPHAYAIACQACNHLTDEKAYAPSAPVEVRVPEELPAQRAHARQVSTAGLDTVTEMRLAPRVKARIGNGKIHAWT
jgi:hypothetical protein